MKQINLYTLEELKEVNEKSFEKAIEELQPDSGWDSYIISDWRDALEEIGFRNPHIEYGGFYHQGSGASFTCKNVVFDTMLSFISGELSISEISTSLLKDVFRKKNEEYSLLIDLYDRLYSYPDFKIIREDFHYSHENTCSIRVDVLSFQKDTSDQEQEELEKLFAAFLLDVEDLRYKLSKMIYKSLEEAYETLSTEESLLEQEDQKEEDDKIYFDEFGRRWE